MEHFIAYEGKTGRMALAEMREEYAPEFVPGINKRIGVEGTLQRLPYSLEMGKEWIRSLDKSRGRDEVFAILLRDSAADGGWRYVGHTGIHGIKWPTGIGTTGSMIFPAEGRGQGHGTEAKLLLLYHSFYILGLRKVKSRVKDFNAASLGHLLKCGYTICGREKEEELHEGEFVDEILLAIFREDFDSVWYRYQETGVLPRLSDEQRKLIKATVPVPAGLPYGMAHGIRE